MCSAAHGWVGLGRIVYASSSVQLVEWQKELGIDPSPVKPLPIQEVIHQTEVDGPDAELAEVIRQLHVKAKQQ